MALFKVNTGLREQEVCQLRWQWEVLVSDLGVRVFVLPRGRSGGKNGQDRLLVLNRIALRIVEEQRGKHREWVFPYKDGPIHRMLNTAWKRARIQAQLPQVRVHDLKHTFGHRLRAAGVGFEDRQDLLGHKSERITTHYSAPDIQRLIEAADRVCDRMETTVLRPVSRTKLVQLVAQKDSSRDLDCIRSCKR